MKTLSYSDLCEKNSVLEGLIRIDQKIYRNWLDSMANLYKTVSIKEARSERIENSSVVSLWMEILETLDGIGILHSKSNINSAYSLIRKLLELAIQFRFMLQDDSENKSLAFEAHYVSKMSGGSDDFRNIYLQREQYCKYKEIADRAFDSKPKFFDWYEIYLGEKTSMNQLISLAVSDQKEIELYQKIYSKLSQENHGFLARKLLKLSDGGNYIESQRYPRGISYQSRLCDFIMDEIRDAICSHYEIERDMNQSKENLIVLHQIESLEEKFLEQKNLPQ